MSFHVKMIESSHTDELTWIKVRNGSRKLTAIFRLEPDKTLLPCNLSAYERCLVTRLFSRLFYTIYSFFFLSFVLSFFYNLHLLEFRVNRLACAILRALIKVYDPPITHWLSQVFSFFLFLVNWDHSTATFFFNLILSFSPHCTQRTEKFFLRKSHNFSFFVCSFFLLLVLFIRKELSSKQNCQSNYSCKWLLVIFSCIFFHGITHIIFKSQITARDFQT